MRDRPFMEAVVNAVTGTLTAGSCQLFSTEPITCPLCKTLVPANTPHKCEVTTPTKKKRPR